MKENKSKKSNLEHIAEKKLESLIKLDQQEKLDKRLMKLKKEEREVKKILDEFNDVHIFSRIVNYALNFDRAYHCNYLYHKAALIDDSKINAKKIAPNHYHGIIDKFRNSSSLKLKEEREQKISQEREKLIDLINNEDYERALSFVQSNMNFKHKGKFTKTGELTYADLGDAFFNLKDYEEAHEIYLQAQKDHINAIVDELFKEDKIQKIKNKISKDKKYASNDLNMKLSLTHAKLRNYKKSKQYFDKLPKTFKRENIEDVIKIPETINKKGRHEMAQMFYKTLLSNILFYSWEGLSKKLGPTKCIPYPAKKLMQQGMLEH